MSELKKILYVEDDRDIQVVAKMALSSIGGFDVLAVNSGKAALEQGKEFAADLFLLDLMMPEMDGIETLNALRIELGFANTPAIFMTARHQKADVEKLMDTGALGVIPKPFDPMNLAVLIRELWEGKAAA